MKRSLLTIITLLMVTFLAVSLSCKNMGAEEGDINGKNSQETAEKEPEAEVIEETGDQTADQEEDQEAEGPGSTEGEYFVGGILKSVDTGNNMIIIEQLINDPDEVIVQPEVVLSPDYKVVKSTLDIEEGEERYSDITLEDIPLGSEIGILFNEDDTADLIIYQVMEGFDDREIIENIVLGFIDAVSQDEEYRFFSSQTRAMVGSEEEYKRGDKSDIYFIIKESHSNWDNVAVTDIVIDGDTAAAEITGDRTAEGVLYQGEEVVFSLIKEGETWYIDFSS